MRRPPALLLASLGFLLLPGCYSGDSAFDSRGFQTTGINTTDDGGEGADGGLDAGGGDSTGDGDGDGDGDGGDGDGDGDGDGGDGDGDGDDPPPMDPSLYARNITISSVEINQGVAIPIGANGQVVAKNQRNARIAKSRDALVRTYVQTSNGFNPRQLVGQLTLEHNGDTKVYESQQNVSGNSTSGNLSTTINFNVEGNYVQPGVKYKVELFEVADPGGAEPANPPRLPSNGSVGDLGVEPNNMVLKVTFVPYSFQGKVPNLNDSNVEALRKNIYERNPVSEVQVNVRNTVQWNGSMSSGNDLSALLSNLSQVRGSDNPAPNVYYEGLIDIGCFAVGCSPYGGITGLGFVPGAEQYSANQRAAVSVFYGNMNDSHTPHTVTHELGHNQGESHIACPGGGAQGTDPSYPHANGLIGVQGYSLESGNLYASNSHYDYMSYCDPTWASDFAWEKTFTRIATLSSWGDELPDQPLSLEHGKMLHGIISAYGRETWWIDEGTYPEDELDGEDLVYLAQDGHAVEALPAFRRHLSDDASIEVLVPLPDYIDDLEGYDAVFRYENGTRADIALEAPLVVSAP